VLTDPLDRGGGPVLLCEPGRPIRYERKGGSPLRRGDIVRLADKNIQR
jgi:hypothetical protein